MVGKECKCGSRMGLRFTWDSFNLYGCDDCGMLLKVSMWFEEEDLWIGEDGVIEQGADEKGENGKDGEDGEDGRKREGKPFAAIEWTESFACAAEIPLDVFAVGGNVTGLRSLILKALEGASTPWWHIISKEFKTRAKVEHREILTLDIYPKGEEEE